MRPPCAKLGAVAVFALAMLTCEVGCSNPQTPLVGLTSSGETTSATSTSGTTGRSSSGTAGTTTTSGATSSGASSGTTVIPPMTLINAGATESFGGLALAFAGGEGELFFSYTIDDGGYAFVLQHLTPAGNLIGSPVTVAVGAPSAPPVVAISSDGAEVAACWEDFGIDPDAYHPCGDAGAEALVLCNSVAVGGSTTDGAMDGGFVGCGSSPNLARSTSAVPKDFPTTLLSYVQQYSTAQLKLMYWPWGYGMGTFLGSYRAAAAVAGPSGYTLFLSHTGEFPGLGYAPVEISTTGTVSGNYSIDLYGGGGYFAGVFAVTARSDDGGPQIGIVLATYTNTNGVVSLVLDPTTATISSGTNVSSWPETPLGLVAATSCGSRFAYVYAVDGGNVMLRTSAPDGTLSDAGSTAIGNLGTNATSIAFVATDGGALLALGTAGQIGLYFVACP
jgi:hypothetical protein